MWFHNDSFSLTSSSPTKALACWLNHERWCRVCVCVMLTVSDVLTLSSFPVCVCVSAGDLSTLKEKSFTLQEGAEYRLKIHFKVGQPGGQTDGVNDLYSGRIETSPDDYCDHWVLLYVKRQDMLSQPTLKSHHNIQQRPSSWLMSLLRRCCCFRAPVRINAVVAWVSFLTAGSYFDRMK